MRINTHIGTFYLEISINFSDRKRTGVFMGVIRNLFRKILIKVYGAWSPDQQAYAERVLKSIFGLKTKNEK